MTVEHYLDRFEQLAANGSSGAGGAGGNGRPAQPAWLEPLRREALGRFSAAGFPTTRVEDWKFTSVAAIAREEFALLAEPASGPEPEEFAGFLVGPAAAHRLVFVNGHYRAELSSIGTLPDGVRLTNLATAWNDPALAAHLSRETDSAATAPGGSSFTDLNTAFMGDGVVLQVPAGVALERPVEALFLTDVRSDPAAGASHPRSLYLLEAGARATVIETYAALGDAGYFTNAVTEASLAAGSRLEHYKLQRESEQAYHVGTFEAHQEAKSELVSLSFAIGAALSRSNVYTVLDGDGAHATMNGLYVVHGSQHVDHQTRIEHAQPNCTSHEVYKGILDGESHGVFNGKVYVQPIAQGTDGKQTNQNLLMSPTAQVDTKPQLEIYADDVRCTHGATVGQLDPLAVFYCKSRGLDEAQARTLLTYGFAADVLEQIPSRAVADHLERLVMRRFLGTGAA